MWPWPGRSQASGGSAGRACPGAARPEEVDFPFFGISWPLYHKIIYGSDWPVITAKSRVVLVRREERTEVSRRPVLAILLLVSRPRSPVHTEGGDAPGAQGARRAHTASMQPTSNPPPPRLRRNLAKARSQSTRATAGAAPRDAGPAECNRTSGRDTSVQTARGAKSRRRRARRSRSQSTSRRATRQRDSSIR